MHQAISIDNYLDAHQEDKYVNVCGKLGIVKTILEAEGASLLYFDETNRNKMDFAKIENTWYGAFQKLLMENVDKINICKIFENVSFITFNYDRCIEHFLVQSVANYYAIPTVEVYGLVKQEIIRHPYGVVGLLPWQDLPPRVQPVSFGQIENVDLLTIARQINTFTEQQKDKQKLADIRRTIQEAEVIVFLGFAFHERNMELLNPGDKCRAKKIYLTYKGISNSDFSIVKQSIKKTIQSDYEIFPLNSECALFFDQFRLSLTS